MNNCSTTNEREIQDLKLELKETKKQIEEMNKRVYQIEKQLDIQEIGRKSNLEMILANSRDINDIKDKPNRRENQIITVVITGVVTAIITYITSKL